MTDNVLALRQHSDSPLFGISTMLLSVLLFSMMDATVKWLGGSYPTRQIMFFRCVVAMIPVSIIIYTRGGIAQYMMTVSYRHTIIAIVAPLKYLSIVIGGVFAYFIWSKIPDLQGFIGIAIIVLSGLYTLHREVLYARRQNL